MSPIMRYDLFSCVSNGHGGNVLAANNTIGKNSILIHSKVNIAFSVLELKYVCTFSPCLSYKDLGLASGNVVRYNDFHSINNAK